MRQLYGSTYMGGGVSFEANRRDEADINRAIEAKREAEREYSRSVDVLASAIAENLNDLPFGMSAYLYQDPNIAINVVRAIANRSRDRVQDLRFLRESIDQIDGDDVVGKDRDLAIRVIEKHIKLNGG